jgi:uroporphyrinogen-III decarboxylase
MNTSRERLIKSIRHQSVDRVPISTYELVGWNENAWENKEPSYKRLMDAIRQHTDCIYMLEPGVRDVPNTASLEEEWREGSSFYRSKVFHTKSGDLKALYRTDEGIHTTWTVKHLLEEVDDIDRYLSLPYNVPEFDMNFFFEEQTKLADRGVMMISVYDPICLGAELFEMSTFLIHAITETKKIKYFLDAIFERQLHSLRKLLKYYVKDIIFRICGPEYATPPYLSPDYYYNFVTCYLVKMCREIKDAGGIPRIHSHGKISKVVNQFAQTEAEGIDPIEPCPDGDINLAEVKRLYGDKFCLFGNIELKELETSDPKRIDALVKRAMEEGKEGGGFILMPTASPINVPLSTKMEENYLQMIESALQYGKY